jgi:hypothetical protein
VRKKNMRITVGLVLYLLSVTFSIHSQIVLPLNSDWKYFKGTSAPSADNESWKKMSFDDSSWPKGNAPFRYGDGVGGTLLSDMQNNYSSVFLRKTINIITPDSLIDKAKLIFDYDDGFRLYINGKVVLERFAPHIDKYDTFATASRESQNFDTVELKSSIHGIKNGANTIVVALYNVNLTSSDIYFDINIELPQKPPKSPDAQFSVNGGYFASPFNLTLSSVNAGDTIRYTVDCSEPDSSPTAFTVISPYILNINPSGMIGRPSTPAVVIRASVMKSGFQVSSESRTYIFTNSIRTQSNPGGNWPSRNINSQIIDYDIDSRIVNDSRYSSVFNSTFSSIPTASLVTDIPNLFDSLKGIYVNALNHGDDWEVPASLELINKDNTEAFSVNIGSRVRGGWSRHPWNPKHAFRIFLKDEYGKKSLKYPLFGSEAAQEFEKFDLRCAENYSWSFYNNPVMTYAQDEFCRDVQGMMGEPFSRSRYCHLFLNGMYWGLYEFQERPEANFGASYLGGKKDNFDVIKVAVDLGYITEATDGTMDKWQQLLNLTNQGFSTNTNYYKLQGRNDLGQIDTTLEALANIDNLIDFMLNIFYSGNFDSPLTIWGNNNTPNNFYALKDRNHKREGFIFIIHDAEHTLNYVPGSEHPANLGVYENRVDLINQGMSAPSILNFTPQWLHYRLTFNSEYKQRFMDKAYKYLYNNGLYTPTVAMQNFKNRTDQINMAIIAESARWGDINGPNLLTKDDDWIPAVNNTISQFINLRTPIVIDQLESAGLLSNFVPPIVKKDGVALSVQSYNLTSEINITLSNPNTSGIIYYTLDGSDPRITGGQTSSTAVQVDNDVAINIPYPLLLKTRILDGSDWSPLRELLFTNKENRDNIRITEIQYNPDTYGSKESKDLEFLEFKNIGDKGIDMGGLKIDSGVNFTFPAGTIINPKGFVVIASEEDGFEYLYNMKPTGYFSGNLSNEGERIVLTDENNNILINLKYDEQYPWPIKANGTGYSMVAKTSSPGNNPDEPMYWQGSRLKYGSPFSDDSGYVRPTITESLTIANCKIYPVPSSNMVYIKSNNNTKIKMIQIFDVSGRLLLTKFYDSRQNNGNLMEVSLKSMNIASGIYLLKAYTQRGTEVKKLVYRRL